MISSIARKGNGLSVKTTNRFQMITLKQSMTNFTRRNCSRQRKGCRSKANITQGKFLHRLYFHLAGICASITWGSQKTNIIINYQDKVICRINGSGQVTVVNDDATSFRTGVQCLSESRMHLWSAFWYDKCVTPPNKPTNGLNFNSSIFFTTLMLVIRKWLRTVRSR